MRSWSPCTSACPFSVRVTGSFGTGWLVYVLRSVPETGVRPL